MLTVTSKAFHDKLQVDDEEVILNGPPDLLKGNIILNNNQDEKISVRELPLQHSSKSVFSNDISASALRLAVRLNPNETKREEIMHQVNPQTPPGVYESSILVGGEKRKLKLVIQPNVKIEINPVQFTFQGTAPGTKHTAIITLTNKGNMPFQIPEVKHVTMVDMDYMCRATALAIRSKGASESYSAMMDELTRNIFKNMTDWINANLKEAGEVLAPGATQLVELSLVLPKDAEADRDYSGDIRLWDQTINYTIKAHNVAKTSKK